jgi:hypothetical protein
LSIANNIKIKINKTIILSVVSYGCEAWSVKLREEFRVTVFKNRVLRRIFESKDKVTEELKDYKIRSFIIFTHHILFR